MEVREIQWITRFRVGSGLTPSGTTAATLRRRTTTMELTTLGSWHTADSPIRHAPCNVAAAFMSRKSYTYILPQDPIKSLEEREAKWVLMTRGPKGTENRGGTTEARFGGPIYTTKGSPLPSDKRPRPTTVSRATREISTTGTFKLHVTTQVMSSTKMVIESVDVVPW